MNKKAAIPAAIVLGLVGCTAVGYSAGVNSVSETKPQVVTKTVEVKVPGPVMTQVVTKLVPAAQGFYVPECVQEDSLDCFWDATTRGNKIGDSFINRNGVIYREVK